MYADPVVIVDCARSPIGDFMGALAPLSAHAISSQVNRALIARNALDPATINEVILGCVLTAGQGQAPARQAALNAGIPEHVAATTINKMCGSGMQAVMLAHDLLFANQYQLILAGGMESMSNAPYLLPKARQGYRLGHGELKDHLFLDGLEDAYQSGHLMGYLAEATATKFAFSRAQQDEFATESLQRAIHAQANGFFAQEIIPIEVQTRKHKLNVVEDESVNADKLSKIGRLKPAFVATGTVTAANSSSISDGAASMLLMRADTAAKQNLQPLAKIIAHASHAQAPEWFTTAPIQAIKKVLEKAQWSINDVDLFEINEAFAVVTMAAMQALHLTADKVNVHGGACALGHPIGASGARIIGTLIYALKRKRLKRGVAALCIGGGEATAIAIEII